MRRRRRRAPAALALLAVVTFVVPLAGCGLPTDEAYKPIDQADLPFGLADTTTTSTTTTTLPPATTTSVPATTTTALPTEPITLYFVSGSLLQPVVVEGSPPVTPRQALDLLQAGPSPEVGLRTSIPVGALVAVTVAGGKATVDLAPTALEQVGQEQLFEIAQIVLTLTDLRGVGQVEFRVPGPDGQPTVINVQKGTGELVPVVSRDDYLNLLSPT